MSNQFSEPPPTARQPTGGQGLVLTPRGKVPVSVYGSGAATVGQALLADGSGGAAFGTVSAGATYTTYTPTWTSDGTPPAIGNATVVARYAQIGKFVHAYGRLVFGTTSTYGTGNYSFALPVAEAATEVMGSVFLYDSSGPNMIFGFGTSNTLTFTVFYGATYAGVFTQVGAAGPWTWATGDHVAWNLTYEAT